MNRRLQSVISTLAVAAIVVGCSATPATAPPTAAPTTAPTAPPATATAGPPTPAPTPAPTPEPTAAPTPEPTPVPTPVEKATITYWLDANDLAPVIQKNIIDPFNAQSASTHVEVTVQPNRWDATRAALNTGSAPDLIGTPGPSFVIQLAKNGFLLPLDDYAQQAGWAQTILPWAIDLGKVNGLLYSLPTEVETLVLFYNKTLFDAHDWTPPTTVAALTTLSEEMKTAGVVPFAHANAEYRQADEWYITEFLNHIAGPQAVYEALTGARPWTDPAFVEAMDTLADYQKKGYFMGGLDKYYTVTFAERDADFADGKAAMDIEGTWYVGTALGEFGSANQNTNDWDWAPVPSKSGDPIFDLGIGGSLSINKATAHPENAAEFMTYWYRPDVQASQLNSGFNAAPVTIDPSLLTNVDPRYAQIIAALGQASAKGDYGYTSWTFWPPKSEAYLTEVEKVWNGDATSAEFLAGLQTIFDGEKADLPPIPIR